MYKIYTLLVHWLVISRVVKHGQWAEWFDFVEFGCYVKFTIWYIYLEWNMICACVIYQSNEKFDAYMVAYKLQDCIF